MASELNKLTIAEASAKLRAREITATDLTRDCLDRIAAAEPKLHAFITVCEKEALEQARSADVRLAAGNAPALCGIPLGIKDIYATKGVRTTCASRILEHFVPPFDATVIERLRTDGAIFIGKTNLDEFAMGSSTENSAFGATTNPHDITRVAGGSSGGSAAAVAAHECLGALGTDTGGSIREPASFCGVVGIKPTYSRVSRYGVIAYASSLDQVGPFAKSVRAALKNFESRGAATVEISLPHTGYAVAAYYLIATAEASANLARYDGIRYGLRVNAEDNIALYETTRAQGFGAEVKRRIMLGTFALSAGYYDAYYLKGQKVRTLIRNDFERAFEQCDLIVTPVAPTTAFKLGEKMDDPLTMYLSDIFTISVNLAGLPGMAMPCGYDSNNLPIGMQLIAPPFAEEIILRAGDAFERTGAFKPRTPAV